MAFSFALIACLVAAAASLLRGGRYHHEESELSAALEGEAVEPGIAPARAVPGR